MKARLYTIISIVGLMTLLFHLSSCAEIGSSADLSHLHSASPEQNPNDRILQSLPKEGYRFVKDWKDQDSSYHFVAEYKGLHKSYGEGKIIKNIELIVSFHQKDIFRIKIIDHDQKRWEIPEEAPFPHFQSNTTISIEDGCCTIDVQKDPFSFVITRKDTQEILFDTRKRDFVFTELYIQLSTALPSDNVFGFGERNYKFRLSPGIYTIWGRDDPMIRETGEGGANTYSHHPVGLMRDNAGNFFMTLMRNSNAMDVIVEDKPALTYKIVGGVIDLIFFIGNDYPEPLLKSYHNYIGNFTMMPFWSMGYHQSKWGYYNYDVMEEIVNGYIKNNIPLDVIWSDIDYMIEKEIFTVDTSRYPPAQMKELTTKYKKKWVPIIDPGVKKDWPSGPGATEGLKRDIFIKNYRGENLVGSVWPGAVYFVDYFHPDAEKYWSDMLEVLHQIIPFAGIWLDMNELANFVDGEESRRDGFNTKYDRIPYTPGNRPLRRKTVSLDAVHHGGIIEYDAHGLFSLMENAATHKYLQTKSKLPFILTRSSSMGVGKYAAHWTGDNGAHWDFLKMSIPGNFNFQIFGIPFVGADICGFMDDTHEELCARWTQVGALYPFARNHHEDRTRNQEPWTFRGTNRGVTIVETTRAALKTRYSILKWYYSLFIETGGSGSIFKPLMFEFPHEEELYQDGHNDWEFLLGKGVLCTPKVEPGEPYVTAYFPQALWYDLFTGKLFIDKESSDREKRVETPFNTSVPMFLRGGHIVHRQEVDHVLSTEDLNDEFELIVGLEKESGNGPLSAKGTMMGINTFDDSSVYDRCMEDNCLYDINVTVLTVEASSATVEVRFKRQSQQVKRALDSFGLYGLRLYGLPLRFMTDDERKVGFALVQKNGDSYGAPDIRDAFGIEDNAFSIDFGAPLQIRDGDVVKIEIIV